VRLFYATDVHGSDRCFTKFVNAGKFYGVDAVVLGGDITGKAIVPLTATGEGRRQGRFLGEELVVDEGAPLEELEKKIANTGYYAWRCESDEEEALRGDAAGLERLFVRLIMERLQRWLALADERLRPEGIACYVNAGNDDPAEIDAVFEDTGWTCFLEGRVVDLPDGTEMASCGFANRTPWNCPRDVEEDELARRYENAIAGLREPEQAIFNFHCPPYDTGIDSGPRLNEEYRVRSGAGGVDMHPVGSTACRAAIERHQPLLGLHGHLHESRGTYKLGRTLCLNPGSEYTEGVLRGSLIEIRKGKVKSQQFTAG
jgi:Icc-related predicted phosphoesterase